MFEGLPLVDFHVHLAALPTLKLPYETWTAGFDTAPAREVMYDEQGRLRPGVVDEHFAVEGADRVLLFCEYSPRVTGWQSIEDMLPVVEHNPERFRVVGNVNPHVHFPVLAEWRRQQSMGAVALKLHPVHAGFPMDDPELYPLYAACEADQAPVVMHAGTSTFPGADNRYATLEHVQRVIRDFPDLPLVLSHGGRGWAYDAAAVLALSYPNVWIDVAGLPPKRLPHYFARHDLPRLARRFLFGTDWPGIPGVARNARAVASLGLPPDVLAGVLGGNAARLLPVLDLPIADITGRPGGAHQ